MLSHDGHTVDLLFGKILPFPFGTNALSFTTILSFYLKTFSCSDVLAAFLSFSLLETEGSL
jgi:hypothetical protein